jgi:hypothetical protein
VTDFIGSALTTVLTWDLPDDVLPEALFAQASFMARIDGDERREEVAD